MDMGPRAAARAAGQGEDVAGMHRLSHYDENHGVVTISRDKAVAVIDFDKVSVAVYPAGRRDFTGRRRLDGRTVIDGNIQAFVEARAAADGVAAVAEVRRNRAVRRPDRRRRRRCVLR